MEIFQQLANGLALGSGYALIALGYSMVYGIIQLINFAHGEFYMLGAYAGFIALRAGWPLWAAFLLSMAGGAAVSMAVERIGYRPLRDKNAGRLAPLITAIAFSILLQNLMVPIGELGLTHSVLGSGNFHFWGIELAPSKLMIFASSVILMAFLSYVVHHTRLGKAMRSVSANKQSALLMGINPNVVISFTFALGGALAGAAGMLVALDQNQVGPFMGLMPGLKAFIAAVVGGIGSIPGAVMGGLVLGLAETLAVVVGLGAFKDAVAFILLIAILLFKPSGLFLKSLKEKV